MVQCLAQGHKCHDRESNPHSVDCSLKNLSLVTSTASNTAEDIKKFERLTLSLCT